MAELKDAFSSLTSLDFDAVPHEDFPAFFRTSFRHGEVLVNSVPIPPPPDKPSSFPLPTAANTAAKASDTLSAVRPPPVRGANQEDQKGWGKAMKLNTRDNPLGVSVYKMAAHDRHGAWFARRSVHQGIGFGKFKAAMQREFLHSLGIKEGPGSGSVRGIAADRRVEKRGEEGVGEVEVWQMSAQFGPITPREFVTLLVTSDNALTEDSIFEDENGSTAIPRHFMVISRPSTHSDVTLRKELVKGSYESVELIREIPLPQSSLPRLNTNGTSESDKSTENDVNPVEWIMITRSDPGGGIPKFMVERGTPSSIVGDVSKFLDWACGLKESDLETADKEAEIRELNDEITSCAGKETPTNGVDVVKQSSQTTPTQLPSEQQDEPQSRATQLPAQTPSKPPAQSDVHEQGSYLSYLSNAVGTTMSGYLPFFNSDEGIRPTVDAAYDSDSSSSTASTSTIGTWRSAGEEYATAPPTHDPSATPETASLASGTSEPGIASSLADIPRTASALLDRSATTQQQKEEKELTKLSEKRATLTEKFEKAREADASRAAELSTREAKDREKALARHEKDAQKQQARYTRELEKLDERRKKEEQRLEERRRKAAEKDVLARAQREREQWRERCRVAERENELLRNQVAGLQKENTMLVAHMSVDRLERVRRKVDEGAASRPASQKSGRSERSAKSGVAPSTASKYSGKDVTVGEQHEEEAGDGST